MFRLEDRLNVSHVLATQIAVNRIAGGKWSLCAGQACLAIDYILVEEEFAPALVRFSLISAIVNRITYTLHQSYHSAF